MAFEELQSRQPPELKNGMKRWLSFCIRTGLQNWTVILSPKQPISYHAPPSDSFIDFVPRESSYQQKFWAYFTISLEVLLLIYMLPFDHKSITSDGNIRRFPMAAICLKTYRTRGSIKYILVSKSLIGTKKVWCWNSNTSGWCVCQKRWKYIDARIPAQHTVFSLAAFTENDITFTMTVPLQVSKEGVFVAVALTTHEKPTRSIPGNLFTDRSKGQYTY